jgi:hypothetical protein
MLRTGRLFLAALAAMTLLTSIAIAAGSGSETAAGVFQPIPPGTVITPQNWQQ